MNEQSKDQALSVDDKINLLAGEIDSMEEKNTATQDTPPAKTDQTKEGEVTEVKAGSGAEGNAAPPDTGKLKKKLKWEGTEYEVTEDELVELAQKGFDYTQKTQRLSEKERSLAPLEGLAKTIESDPAFAAHLREYFVKGKEPKAEPEPEFDDPLDKVKYDIEKMVTEKFRKELSEKERQVAHQLMIQRVKNEVQRDPDFQDVTNLMINHIKSLPEPTGKMVFLQWDQDPDAYLKAFSHYKEVVSTLKTQKSTRASDDGADQTKPNPPEATRRQEKAPILEASGSGTPPDKAAERRKQLSKMKAKALRSGDPLALADWLAESGAIDHLT